MNAAGHRHFVTNYFSATDTVREGVWEWQKPPNFLILHPGMLLVQFNGSPEVRKLILELADGYLAHGKTDADGRFVLPLQINWRTDQGRSGGGPGGNSILGAAAQVFWAAWRWTGDPEYLAPLTSDADKGGWGGLSSPSADVTGALDKRATWGCRDGQVRVPGRRLRPGQHRRSRLVQPVRPPRGLAGHLRQALPGDPTPARSSPTPSGCT